MHTTRITIKDNPAGGFCVSVLDGNPATVVASTRIGRCPPSLEGLPPGIDVFEAIGSLLVADGDSPVRPAAAAHYLFELVATGEVKDWVERSSKEPAGTRHTLLDTQSNCLSRLPWELMTDPATGWAPFLRATNPWSRLATQQVEARPIIPPVRVLFVAGDVEDVGLIADAELDAIIGVLCRDPARWHVEHLIAPTQAEFDDAYQELRPDVLHVVAHGRRSRDGAHVLAMRERTKERKERWDLTAFTVSNLPSDAPRLVVLNACRSGVSPDERASAWTFKDAFLDRGAAAVVTMQGDIPSPAAVAFCAGFYKSLARTEPVDLAAAHGRWEASRASGENPAVWSLPCLAVTGSPEDVLAIQGRRVHPRFDELADDAARMLDQARDRRRLWHRAAPADNGSAARPHVIVVTGPKEVGKSAVVKAALLACHVRGCDIAYIDFRGDRRLDWFGAVMRLHQGLMEWLPERTEALADFEHAVDLLREGRDITPRPERGGHRLPHDARFVAQSDCRDDRIAQTFKQVVKLLRACVADDPLVLVLDHLSTGLSDEAREYVVPQLVEPLAKGAISKLTLVTVVGSMEVLRGKIPPRLLEEPIVLEPFDAKNISLLFHELHARRFPGLPAPDQIAQAIAEGPKKKFLPREILSIGEGLIWREPA